jgi:hypothetical protein
VKFNEVAIWQPRFFRKSSGMLSGSMPEFYYSVGFANLPLRFWITCCTTMMLMNTTAQLMETIRPAVNALLR